MSKLKRISPEKSEQIKSELNELFARHGIENHVVMFGYKDLHINLHTISGTPIDNLSMMFIEHFKETLGIEDLDSFINNLPL